MGPVQDILYQQLAAMESRISAIEGRVDWCAKAASERIAAEREMVYHIQDRLRAVEILRIRFELFRNLLIGISVLAWAGAAAAVVLVFKKGF